MARQVYLECARFLPLGKKSQRPDRATLGTLRSGPRLESFAPALLKQRTKELLVSDSIRRVSCKCSPGFEGGNSKAQYFVLAQCA